MPELSLVIPLYNEEGNVARVARELATAFAGAGIDYELVLVANGSHDRTPELIDQLAAENPHISPVRIQLNQGYGNGILTGLAAAKGNLLGFTWGDDQIKAADAVRVYEKLKAEHLDVCKTTRIERHDGFQRRVITTIFNSLFPLMFGTHTRDINGCPKIFTRDAYNRLKLFSRDWFLDAEFIIKAERMKLKMGEIQVIFHARQSGYSNVKTATLAEFVKNMLKYRLRGGI